MARITSAEFAEGIALMLGVCLFQSVLSGVRLREILHTYKVFQCTKTCIVHCYIGNFFSQTFVSIIGGDAMRIWRLTKSGVRVRTAGGAIFLDRATGLIALILLFGATVPEMSVRVEEPIMQAGLYSMLAVGAAGIAGFYLLPTVTLRIIPTRIRRAKIGDGISDVLNHCRIYSRKGWVQIRVLLLGVILHTSNIIALWALLLLFGADVGFWEAALLLPVGLLLSALPISFAGWGVREGTLVYSFAVIGVPSDIVLAASVVYGIGLLVGYSPGLLMFLFKRDESSAASQAIETKEEY